MCRCLKEEVAVQADKYLTSIIVQRPKVTVIEEKVTLTILSGPPLFLICVLHVQKTCTSPRKRRSWVRAFSVALAVSDSWKKQCLGKLIFDINLLLNIREIIICYTFEGNICIFLDASDRFVYWTKYFRSDDISWLHAFLSMFVPFVSKMIGLLIIVKKFYMTCLTNV